MASENKAPAEEQASKPTLMSLPFEIRKQIFALAEPSGDKWLVFLCDCHSHELRAKHTRIGQSTSQYRPPPALARPLLRVSNQVRAEAKDIIDQRRTLIACSILCAADAFKLMPEHELNMTKTVLITRTLDRSIIYWHTHAFKLRYMQYIRDELQASHFETAKLISIEMKEEGGFLLFKCEFEVGRWKEGASRGAEGGFTEASDVNAFRLLRLDERMWRRQNTSDFLEALEAWRVESRLDEMRRRATRESLE